MLFDPPLMGTRQQLFHQRPPSPHILVTKSSFDIAESSVVCSKPWPLRPPPPETQAGQLQPPPPTPSGGLVNGASQRWTARPAVAGPQSPSPAGRRSSSVKPRSPQAAPHLPPLAWSREDGIGVNIPQTPAEHASSSLSNEAA